MRSFYQEIITQKSWEILKKLQKKVDFILIGGWAVYFYTSALKSKDIDIIIDYPELERLKKEYEVFKNERLEKYEIKEEGVDIDAYLPHFSNVGLPVEVLLRYKQKRENFAVLPKEVLLITKQKAYLSRVGSIKGEKDKIDIISLAFLDDFDWSLYKEVLKKYQLENYLAVLKKLLAETYEVKELGLTRHIFSQKKKEVLARLGEL